jgi:ABC-type sugar transport system ATPase subunit
MIALEDVSKSYAPSVQALDGVTLKVAAGECLAIVGPSGCGKTTLLRLIAGLEEPTSGTIKIDDRDVAGVPSHQRGVAMLFQRPALVLSQSVRQNLRWAWTLQKPWTLFSRAHDTELVRIARLLELDAVVDRPVQQLSGGQQQRVALGRCLLRQAKILLLDEPLGHLDAPLRTDLRRQIRSIVESQGMTTLHVTHDPEEAFAVGDRVAVVQSGRLAQIDRPDAIRRCPANRYVAALVHHQRGGVNFLAGEILRHDMDTFFVSAFGRWPMSVQIVQDLRESLCEAENFHQGEGKVHIIMGVPVEDVCCTTASLASADEVCVVLPVKELESGDERIGVIAADARGRWNGRAKPDERLERGQAVTMAFTLAKAYWFDAQSGRTLAAPAG